MPNVGVILVAAGQSSRFGDSRRKKPFIELKGRPVWVRAVEVFANRDDVDQLLIVVSPDEETLDRYRDSAERSRSIAERLLSLDFFPVCSPAFLANDKPLTDIENLRYYTLLHDAESVVLQFAVEDTGIGIDARNQATIFDSFNR